MSGIEDRVRASLQDRAGDVEPTPALQLAVERRITRRRRLRAVSWTSAAAAAVLAAVVVVPSAVDLAGRPEIVPGGGPADVTEGVESDTTGDGADEEAGDGAGEAGGDGPTTMEQGADDRGGPEGADGSGGPDGDAAPQRAPDVERNDPHGVLFTPDEVAEGDEIAGLRVASVGPFREDAVDRIEPNVRVEFAGEVELTGTWRRYEDDDDRQLRPDMVAFTVTDPDALARLPRIEPAASSGFDPDDPVTLLFSNQQEAREAFGPPGASGEATVTVDRYVIERYPSDGAATRARLLDVQEEPS